MYSKRILMGAFKKNFGYFWSDPGMPITRKSEPWGVRSREHPKIPRTFDEDAEGVYRYHLRLYRIVCGPPALRESGHTSPINGLRAGSRGLGGTAYDAGIYRYRNADR